MNLSRPSSGLFVAGTDTEVGKTFVSAVLTGLARRRGVAAGWLKPVGSGALAAADGPASPDALFVVEQVGLADRPEDLCPVLAAAPLAPAEALAREGRDLDWPTLLAECKARLARAETTFVEGVGGLLVPLSERRLLVDLMAALALPVLVVARPGLGTINHTLLTLAELKRRRLKTSGFVFSGAGGAAAVRANAGWIERFSGVFYRGWLRPRGEAGWEEFLDQAEKSLTLRGLPGFEE